MVTESKSRYRLIGRPALILIAATLFPALVSTLVVWRFFPDWWLLSVFFWYSIPGNSFILIPHEPAVIYAGTLYVPLLVALVGGAATMLASIVDHILITRAFQLKSMTPIKNTRVMRMSTRLFNRMPWLTIIFFAFTPIPFYPIRIVAPMANYPLTAYVSAVVVGRVPRYYLLALGGVWAKHLTLSYLS